MRPGEPNPKSKRGYGDAVFRGGLISGGAQLGTAAIGYVVQLVLAWFLSRSDFGLVALAGSFASFVAVFRDAGATRILISRTKEFDQLAPTVFWITFVASMGCAAFTILSAPVVSHIYGDQRLPAVLVLIALRFPVAGLGTVSAAKLNCDMRWRAVAYVQLSGVFLSGLLSVLLAIRGWGMYALLVPPIFGDALRGVAAWWVAGVGSISAPNVALAKKIILSSSYLIGSGLTLAARNQGDYITLGLLTTIQETGAYYFAFTTAGILGRLLVSTLNPVVYPVFAQLADEPQRIANAFRRAFHSVAIFLVPITCLQAVLARPAFALLLDPKWRSSADLFSVLVFFHMFTLLNGLVVQPLHALGQFRFSFRFDLIFTPVELTLFAVGGWLGGATGVAWAATLSALIGFTAWHLASFRVLGFDWRPLLIPLWRPAVASVPILLLAGGWSNRGISSRANACWEILTVGTGGIVFYILLVRFLWQERAMDIMALIGRARGRGQSSPEPA